MLDTVVLLAGIGFVVLCGLTLSVLVRPMPRTWRQDAVLIRNPL